MIVSHKHKFIFLKTAKAAGTSIETALAPRCGPADIIASSGRARPFDRNQHRGLGRLGIHLPGGIARHVPQLSGFYSHMPGRQVRAMVGEEVWTSYFKFTTDRNPWDRQVSHYFYRHHRKSPDIDFETYLTSRRYQALHAVRVDNWDIFAIDGKIAVDQVIRFEDLAQGFAAICRQLGIGDDVALPKINVGPRKGRGHYRQYYSERTRAIVGEWYAEEIAAVGYEF